MPLRTVNWLMRDEIMAHPEHLYVFGDNMARKGFGGQAKEARGEPNAVGIPTKWEPKADEKSFFTDADLYTVMPVIDEAFDRLEKHLRDGGIVFWPTAGIGTGLAELPQRAPKIAQHIAQRRKLLLEIGRAGR